MEHWLQLIVLSASVNGAFRLGKCLRQNPGHFFCARALATTLQLTAKIIVVCCSLFYASQVAPSSIKQSSISEIRLVNLTAMATIALMVVWAIIPPRWVKRLKRAVNARKPFRLRKELR